MVRVGGTRTAVTVCVLATAAIVVSAGAHVLDRRIGPTGLTRSVSLGRVAQAQHRFPSDVVAQVDLDFIASSPWIPRRFFTVQWEGYWYLRQDRLVDLYAGADDRVVLQLDGETVLDRNLPAHEGHTISTRRSLRAGLHHLSVRFEQDRGGYSMRIGWAPAGARMRPFRGESFFPARPEPDALRAYEWRRWLRRVVIVLWSAVVALLCWPLATPVVTRAGQRLLVPWQQYWVSSWPHRLRPLLPPLAGACYLVLLVRWFGDPGRVWPDGLPYRVHLMWPWMLVTLLLVLGWLWLARERLRRLAREAAAAFLDKTDVLVIVLVTLGMFAYHLPAVTEPAGYLDSDSAQHGIMALHIWDGLVAPPFVYGRLVLGTFSSHLLAGLFAVIGPSVAALVVLSRVYWWIFVLSHYALLRFAFGRVIAVLAAVWLAWPGPFLSWHITYTEFGELFAFSGLALLITAGRLTGRLRDNLWYGLAGFLIGLAFWSHGQAVMVGAALVGTAVCLRGTVPLFAVSSWLLGGVTIGAFPGLVGWGRDFPFFLSWLFASPTDPSLAAIVLRLVDVSRQALPVLFMGHWRPVEVTPVLGAALAAIVLLSCIWGLVAVRHLWRATGRRPHPSPDVTVRVLLAAIALVVLVGYALSSFGDLLFPPRRLILLYMAIPGLVAGALATLCRRLPRRVAVTTVVATMTAWTLVNNRETATFVQHRVARGHQLEAAATALRQEEVSLCEAPYWTAYWLNFATLEHIRCAQYEHSRDPYYRRLVDRTHDHTSRPYIAFLNATGGRAWVQAIRERLNASGVPHREIVMPQFEILLPRQQRTMP